MLDDGRALDISYNVANPIANAAADCVVDALGTSEFMRSVIYGNRTATPQEDEENGLQYRFSQWEGGAGWHILVRRAS